MLRLLFQRPFDNWVLLLFRGQKSQLLSLFFWRTQKKFMTMFLSFLPSFLRRLRLLVDQMGLTFFHFLSPFVQVTTFISAMPKGSEWEMAKNFKWSQFRQRLQTINQTSGGKKERVYYLSMLMAVVSS